jgi:phosphoserine phosphatase
MRSLTPSLVVLAALLALAACKPSVRSDDPLPAWADGPDKQAITAFVRKVSTPGSGFVPAGERIAVFDNDGTLWAEKPVYFEVLFAVDRARAMAAQNPALLQRPAFRAAAASDPNAIARLSEQDLAELITATHSGMSPEAFGKTVNDWIRGTRHPRFQRPYIRLVYEPQLQLLAYLRGAGFKTFIVSGGGSDFMRAFAEQTYGIPPEQVIGSSGKVGLDPKAGITRPQQINSVDDAQAKPETIALHIGQRPILAVGNSDGDLPMLQYAATGPRPNLEIIVHHDDGQREYAYDRTSKVGRLDKAWNVAIASGWVVVSMKRDWKEVFSPTPQLYR